MKLAIENKNLVRVINFLDGLNIKGMKSIHRTNLSLELQSKLKKVAENEKQLKEELKDDQDKLKEELTAFYEEKAIVDGGDSQTMLQSVKSVIKDLVAENSEHEFSNDDAYAVACLHAAFELGGDQ